MIDKPGIYTLSDADYHADPAPEPSLSAGVAGTLLRKTPRHAWMKHPRLNPDFEVDNEPKFDVPKAVHAFLLGGAPFRIVDEKDWRKATAKEQRAAAYAEGKIPLLTHQWNEVAAVADAVKKALDAHTEVQFHTDGKPEQSRFWQQDGIWCRDRPDWLDPNGDIIDLKFTVSTPNGWNRHAWNMDYDVRVGHYRAGSRVLMDNENAQYLFVNIENSPPYDIFVTAFDELALRMCDEKARHARHAWKRHLESGDWPGWSSGIHYVSPPAWESVEWDEYKFRAADQSGDWQAFYETIHGEK